MVDMQPRVLADAPRGIWLGASALREQPAYIDRRYPHICGIEVPGQKLAEGERPKTYWSRDCAACWVAGWRPRDWDESVRRARLAAASALAVAEAERGAE
jgi:hypothetical protein